MKVLFISKAETDIKQLMNSLNCYLTYKNENEIVVIKINCLQIISNMFDHIGKNYMNHITEMSNKLKEYENERELIKLKHELETQKLEHENEMLKKEIELLKKEKLLQIDHIKEPSRICEIKEDQLLVKIKEFANEKIQKNNNSYIVWTDLKNAFIEWYDIKHINVKHVKEYFENDAGRSELLQTLTVLSVITER